jgi:hypothetical protein
MINLESHLDNLSLLELNKLWWKYSNDGDTESADRILEYVKEKYKIVIEED